MKLISALLCSYGILALAIPLFSLSEKFAWMAAGILSIASSIWMPEIKRILAIKLHWRIVLTIGILIGFYVVYLLLHNVMGGLQTYSLSATFFIFGLLAFLVSWLDSRKYTSHYHD